jgi:DNA mismatch repair protein MutS
LETKESHPDSVLFFQVGDFYELFFEDALKVAPLLELTLTSRQKIDEVPVPMCGVPVAAGDQYINRLASMGHKVAVCDQESLPLPGEKVAKRRVKRVVTPGTIILPEDELPKNRWLAMVLPPAGETKPRESDPDSFPPAVPPTAPGRKKGKKGEKPGEEKDRGLWYLAACDVSTGDFIISKRTDFSGILSDLAAMEPGELLLPAPSPNQNADDREDDRAERETPGDPLPFPFPSRLASPSFRARPAARATDDADSLFADFPKEATEDAGAPGGPDGLAAEIPPRPSARAASAAKTEKDGPAALREFAESRDLFVSEAEGELLKDARESLARVYGEAFVRNTPELDDCPRALEASGALVGYLLRLAPDSALSHLAPPRLLWESPVLHMDESCLRTLELVRSLRDGSEEGTVFSLINETVTPPGARLLRDWLVRPARIRKTMEDRHDAVEELIAKSPERDRLRARLKETRDFERAISRLSLFRGSLKDLYSIKKTLSLVPEIVEALKPFRGTDGTGDGGAGAAGAANDAKEIASGAKIPRLALLASALSPNAALLETLERSLADARPQSASEGDALRDELSPKLAELRSLEAAGKKGMAGLEALERKRLGFPVKVGYNRVFGYFLEVTKSHAKKVPESWTRKQTLASAERYVTPELNELEEKIISASASKAELEERILQNLKRSVSERSKDLKKLAGVLSELDALTSLSLAAEKRFWTKPEISPDDVLEIRGGRHPMVEAALPKGQAFVANDTFINKRERILVITGPNMAGKSTILRQAALIVVLCQMGSFVPADSAKLSIRDAVFARVGASDDLAGGRSTFMVEMSETARILARATPGSLVILDEVGRGTSTLDGLAIAWAVAECLHDRAGKGVPTLFATHYHELVDLAKTKPLAVNYNVAVKKWEGKVVFLRKLVPGGTSRSHGIAVAALAGLPKTVVKRAADILRDLLVHQKNTIRPQIRPTPLFPEDDAPDADPGELGELEETGAGGAGLPANAAAAKNDIVRVLKNLDTETLTPLDALNILCGLKDRARKVSS